MERSQAKSIDEYISRFPPEIQALLQEMRTLIREHAGPDAVETISYSMPTFDLMGRHLVHFAAFKNHIGFYPTGSGGDAFEKEFTPYKHSRGSVQFPIGEPLPKDLIARVVDFRVKQVSEGGK